jgi:competence protein ComEC
VGAWGLPLAAASFWLGLLGWQVRPAAVRAWPWWCWLAAGAVALGAAWATAPRRRRGDVLADAGLTSRAAAPVAAVAADGTEGGHGPLGLPLVAVGVLMLAMAWAGLADLRRDTSLLARLAPDRVEVLATLKIDPRPGAYGWRALVDAREVRWPEGAASLNERLWVGGDDDLPQAVRGDLVALTGQLEIPDDPEFLTSLNRQGIAGTLRVRDVERAGPSPSAFVRATQSVRTLVGGSIERVLPPREAGLLLGLALGDDSGLLPATRRDFKATGLTHLLVVSGGNVAMLMAPVMILVHWLGLARVGTAVAGVITVAFIVVLTGIEPSVLRAGTMSGLALVGVLMGRPRSTGVVLSGAVLALLVADPWLAWSVGFQLSTAATAGLVTMASPLGDRLGRILPRPVALAAGTTLAAQLGVTPLLLAHFGDVPLVTLVANVLAAPSISPSLLLGLVAAGAGLLWDPLGGALGLLAQIPMRYLELVANVLGRAPIAHVTSRGGPWVLIPGGAVVAGVAVMLRTGWRPPRRVVVAAVALLPLLAWSTALTKGTPDSLTVRFFDVGQGDAALVTSPAGASILVDGGPDEDEVARELAALGVKRLDVLVASHPHADHIVGLPSVLARVPTSVVLQPGCPSDSSLQADLDAAIGDEGVQVVNPLAGDTFTVGDLRLDVLSPDRCWIGTESDANNDAIVLRVSRGDDVVLIASECEEPAQGWLLESGADLHADVLKVPHHGAGTSLPEFFQAVAAPVAVVSVGENGYGHPVGATLDAIEDAGSTVWRTDLRGTITIAFERGGPVVASER